MRHKDFCGLLVRPITLQEMFHHFGVCMYSKFPNYSASYSSDFYISIPFRLKVVQD